MIWVLVWTIVIFIMGWEILALATKEKYFPTWSRLLWWLQEVHPRARKIILVVTLVIMISITIWMVVHLSEECAFGIC